MIKSFFPLLIFTIIFCVSCQKSENISSEIYSHDAYEMRSELQNNGYIESIVDPILKQECYFDDWNKTILTPITGLIEYHDDNGNWVASIDFGSGACDQWATKTWDVRTFPDYPDGEKQFSVFSFHKKEK
ncbi:MAG: hypothetical protein CMD38_06670 [Flavobacteriales bacterium]|nr:hypothetical protein [Flavobacteriales bacterium]|tara:strand:+ start:9626 stop:10015 length:390 start_codon:yes stop_codon:yes gene_type:complete